MARVGNLPESARADGATPRPCTPPLCTTANLGRCSTAAACGSKWRGCTSRGGKHGASGGHTKPGGARLPCCAALRRAGRRMLHLLLPLTPQRPPKQKAPTPSPPQRGRPQQQAVSARGARAVHRKVVGRQILDVGWPRPQLQAGASVGVACGRSAGTLACMSNAAACCDQTTCACLHTAISWGWPMLQVPLPAPPAQQLPPPAPASSPSSCHCCRCRSPVGL